MSRYLIYLSSYLQSQSVQDTQLQARDCLLTSHSRDSLLASQLLSRCSPLSMNARALALLSLAGTLSYICYSRI